MKREFPIRIFHPAPRVMVRMLKAQRARDSSRMAHLAALSAGGDFAAQRDPGSAAKRFSEMARRGEGAGTPIELGLVPIWRTGSGGLEARTAGTDVRVLGPTGL